MPQLEELLNLFIDCEFNRLDELSFENIDKVATQASYYICAYQEKKLAGFVRLFTDWTTRAFLCNLMVFKRLRGNGIGGKLMEEMLKVCDQQSVPCVNFSDFRNHNFYTEMGFKTEESFNFMYRIHPEMLR